MNRNLLTTAFCAVCFWLPQFSYAMPINVSVEGVDINGNVSSASGQMQLTDPDADGIYDYVAGDLPSNFTSAAWTIEDFNGSFNIDPVVSTSFSVLNSLSTTQTFTITITAVTGAIGAPTTVTGGSAQGGVTDVNNNGATLSTLTGIPFYQSLIDGSDFESLYDDPTSVSVGAYGSGNFSPLEDFGAPIPSFPGPAVTNDIGIRFQFSLTGGDRATGSGVFVVEPVPIPPTVWLFGSGLLGLVGIARRKKV